MKRRKPLHVLTPRQLRRLANKNAQDLLNVIQDQSDTFGPSTSSSSLNQNTLFNTPVNSSVCRAETADLDLSLPSFEGTIHEDEFDSSSILSSNGSNLKGLSSSFVSSSTDFDSDNGELSDAQSYEKQKPQEEQRPKCLRKDLASWAIENDVNLSTTSSLLKVLRSHGHTDLPSDARTLLKTPRRVELREVYPGFYWHAGLERGLKSCLLMGVIGESSEIELAINIDGLPLSKSSGSSLWPILCSVVPFKHVFVVGAYHGLTKPQNPNVFLQEFVSEVQMLCQCGLIFNNKKYNVNIKYFIFDAPAKSFVLCVKGHGGYSSCTKCIVEGDCIENRVCFNDLNCLKRTDRDFVVRRDEEFHMGDKTSVLLEIPNVGLVTNVPLDYMHLVCLGVVRKLLYLWLGGGKKSIRIPHKDSKIISKHLESLRKWIPDDFIRKPRSLEYIKQWKATELRQFLLYTGPIVLKKVVPRSVYKNFLCLSLGIRILCSDKYSKSHTDYADYLLREFVVKFSNMYGEHHVSHNVHGLIHLADDVKLYGILDNFSAFPFENYMQRLKKLVRKSDKPLQQLSKRYSEIESVTTQGSNQISSNVPKKALDKNNGNININQMGLRKVQIRQNVTLDLNSENSTCCLVSNGTVVIVKEIHISPENSLPVVKGFDFKKKTDFFSKPCASSIFNIYVVSDLSLTLKSWSVEEIKTKCLIFPLSNREFTVLPLLHSETIFS